MITDSRVQQLTLFVEGLIEPSDWVEIRRLRPARSSWHHASELHEVADGFARDNRLGVGIYVGVNPRRTVGGQRAGDCTPDQPLCGKCRHCVRLARAIVADFDDTAPSTATDRAANAGMPCPTMVVSSGHGAHLYWRFAEPQFDLSLWTELQKDAAALL
ncbi:MAG: hypothetical protein IH951_15915, partial [Bacteroidetes bacterium]|nr:hypothetical protein [Bacteroidota bacterium]